MRSLARALHGAQSWLSPCLCVTWGSYTASLSSVGCAGVFATWEPVVSDEGLLRGAQCRLGHPWVLSRVSCDSAIESQVKARRFEHATPRECSQTAPCCFPKVSDQVCTFQIRPHLLGPLQRRLCELERGAFSSSRVCRLWGRSGSLLLLGSLFGQRNRKELCGR